MSAERKRNSARESASFHKPRFVAIEALESRLFCDHGLAAAALSAQTRSAARATIIAHAGTSFARAEDIGALSQTTSFRGALSPAGTNEYFKFSVTEACTLGLSLTALSGNADLQLFSATGASPQSRSQHPAAFRNDQRIHRT